MSDLITLSEAARRLNVHRSTIMRHVNELEENLTEMARLHRLLSPLDFAKVESSLQKNSGKTRV